jgi:hypothetical protein
MSSGAYFDRENAATSSISPTPTENSEKTEHVGHKEKRIHCGRHLFLFDMQTAKKNINHHHLHNTIEDHRWWRGIQGM